MNVLTFQESLDHRPLLKSSDVGDSEKDPSTVNEQINHRRIELLAWLLQVERNSRYLLISRVFGCGFNLRDDRGSTSS